MSDVFGMVNAVGLRRYQDIAKNTQVGFDIAVIKPLVPAS